MHLGERTLIYIGLAIFTWDFIWKAFALWRAGRNRQPVWFFFLLVIISIGLLPIIYLLLYPRADDEDEDNRSRRRNR